MKPTLVEGILAIYKRPDEFNRKNDMKSESAPPAKLAVVQAYMQNKVVSRQELMSLGLPIATVDRCIAYMHRKSMIKKIPKSTKSKISCMQYQIVKGVSLEEQVH